MGEGETIELPEEENQPPCGYIFRPKHKKYTSAHIYLF